jgi:hypothetical protein
LPRRTPVEIDDTRGEDPPPTGLVMRLRLVAPGPGRASGTFDAVGAVTAGGTVVTDSFVPSQPEGGSGGPVIVEGAVRMSAPAGELVATIATVVRVVPGTGVSSGGGTWTLTQSTGAYDGLRAAGTMTIVVAYDAAGAGALELVLTGRVAAG